MVLWKTTGLFYLHGLAEAKEWIISYIHMNYEL